MIQIVKFEFGKILHKRVVYAALVILIIMGGAMCNGRGFNVQVALRPDGSGYLEGREAIDYNKAVAAKYEGELTIDKIKEILETYAPDVEDAGFWVVNNTYNIISSFWTEYDGNYNGMTIEEAFPKYLDERPLVLGYNEGWLGFLETGMYMMVFVGFLLVIALSPVFSEEYTRGTDALILTSRHGKGKCALAKILASYLFTLLATGILLISAGIYWLWGFGMEGAGASVQMNTHFTFTGVPYFLTNLETAVYCIVLWLGGSLILTGMILILSALCRSSFITLIAALTCYTVPAMFGQIGVLPQILSLNPIWDFLAEVPVMIPKFSLGGGEEISYVWVVAVFAIIVTGLAFVCGRRIFARHQVA